MDPFPGLSVSAWVSKHGVWMPTLGLLEPEHHVKLGDTPSSGSFKRENEGLIHWHLGRSHFRTNPFEVPTTCKFYVLEELWAFGRGTCSEIWPCMVQCLHFRHLKWQFIRKCRFRLTYAFGSFPEFVEICARRAREREANMGCSQCEVKKSFAGFLVWI